MPTFSDFESHRQWIKEHMAAAFHSFGKQGLAEGLAGHISVRDPKHKNRFWMNPFGVHFSMMKVSDMVLVDYSGNVVGGEKVDINAACFQIHSAVHKALQKSTLLVMLTEFPDGLVLGGEKAERLVSTVTENNKGVILQNQGLLTVGGTVDEAAYLFQLMERLCEIQLKVEAAAAPGNLEKVYIRDDVAKFSFDMGQNPLTMYQEFQPTFKYELWKSKGDPKE